MVADKDNVGLHWFEPFGTTDLLNLCNQPPIEFGKRYVFWDQEPLHQDRVQKFFQEYSKIYKGETTLVHSEYKSQDVVWAKNTYGLNDAYYFFHGWAALDWFRGYNRSFLHRPKHFQYTWLCLNNIAGGQRRHRLELFSELGRRNLVHKNLYSMPKICPYENTDVIQLLEQSNLYVPDIELPLVVDDLKNHAAHSHFISLWKESASCLLQVVTETCFRGQKNHLTEKTFKPIVLKQPFVLVGNRGSLAYLKKYGFKTFDSIWDESYDTEDDDSRIKSIVDLLDELEQQNKHELFKKCEPIVRHNYDWFYGGGFERMLWDELLEMVQKW